MKTTDWILAPALVLALGTQGAALETNAGAAEVRLEDRLDWVDPGLELFLWSMRDLGGRVEVRFCLGLRSGVDVASTHVGYPRYSATPNTWQDAVLVGLVGRNRVVRASRHGPDPRVFFSVLVPRHAFRLRVPVGSEVVDLDLERWLPSLEETEPRVPLRWIGSNGGGEETAVPVSPPGIPVRLETAVRWEGAKPFGDGALDAEESGDLLVDVTNHGERATRGVRVRVQPGQVDGITFPREVRVRVIDPGGTETARLTFRGEAGLRDDTLRLTVEVLEEHGHDAVPIEISLPTRAAPSPALVLLDDFAIEGGSLPLPRDRIVTVRLRVRNIGQGVARNAVANVEPSTGVYLAHDGVRSFALGDLAPGDVAEIEYRCYANQRAPGMDLRVELSAAGTGGTPVGSTVSLPLEDSARPSTVVRIRADSREAAAIPPAPAPLTSDVDRDVPRSLSSRPDALAVVFGVENHASAPPALFAADDARTATAYFERVLGIPGERILLLLDSEVTLGQFRRVFGDNGWLARRSGPETEVFVFFAGHGMIDPGDLELYLVPSDGDVNYVHQTAFPLDLMLRALSDLEATNVTLFLDTCFSGRSRRGETLLAGTRPLLVVPEERSAVPGVSIYSAASGSQVAGTLDDHGHGLFTYHLFRGLGGAADLDGDRAITALELRFYLEETVPRAAAAADHEQTPSAFLHDPGRVLVELP